MMRKFGMSRTVSGIIRVAMSIKKIASRPVNVSLENAYALRLEVTMIPPTVRAAITILLKKYLPSPPSAITVLKFPHSSFEGQNIGEKGSALVRVIVSPRLFSEFETM
jgi:hypothetical protein